MPRSENQKLKLLYLKELFETQSDEQHILSMQDIVSYLAARGIRAERKSVYGDISCLQEFGMDIVLQKGPGGGYFLASRPFELAELKLQQHAEKISDLKGVQMKIEWGSQIRSYVFMPYTLAKDTRTGYEMGNIQAVMDGDIDGFINAYLTAAANGEIKK